MALARNRARRGSIDIWPGFVDALAQLLMVIIFILLVFTAGQFFLADQSTNGTFVTVDGDAEVILKREQILLRGRGVICLGHSTAAGQADAVTFAVD